MVPYAFSFITMSLEHLGNLGLTGRGHQYVTCISTDRFIRLTGPTSWFRLSSYYRIVVSSHGLSYPRLMSHGFTYVFIQVAFVLYWICMAGLLCWASAGSSWLWQELAHPIWELASVFGCDTAIPNFGLISSEVWLLALLACASFAWCSGTNTFVLC
jgi:hypothetical protein